MFAFINPKNRLTTLQHLVAFYVITSLVCIGVTTLGINVSVFVVVLPFAYMETLHYRALLNGYKFYDVLLLTCLFMLNVLYANFMLIFEVTKISFLSSILAFVTAGVLFGHMRYVLVQLKNKETQQ